jgi:hypothetical protein
MDPSLFDNDQFYQRVGKDLPLGKRLLANLVHAQWLLVISYLYHDETGNKMLEIYNTIFGRNITDVCLLEYGYKWDALQKYYPELDLPFLGDGLETVDDVLVSTYPKFVAIRAELLTYVPNLLQYVA